MSFDLPISLKFDVKNETLKKHLIECVKLGKKQFIEVAESFYERRRRQDVDYRRLCDAMISTIDEILAADDWDASLFLRNTIKPLRQLREQALQMQASLAGIGEKQQSHVLRALDQESVKLYISLYQSNGHDLKQWAAQLASLSSYMIGRPIYDNESHVVEMIRMKLSQVSEAYVVIAVKRNKITVEQNKPRLDRFGHELITLLPTALTDADIIEFVHLGKHYYFENQQLVLITPNVIE